MPSERTFGVSVGTVTLIIAAWLAWRGVVPLAGWLAALGLVLIISGVMAPAVLRVPNRIWWRIALVLGWINTRLLLGAFFFVILTPTGLVMRLFGRSPLRTAQSDTNWSPCNRQRRGARHYERLY
jgi:hypothetical protein